MGTAVTIEIADRLPEHRLSTLVGETCAWLHEVDRRFSTYRSDSEVSRLDAGDLPDDERSADLTHVLRACAELWRETDGYFDVYATGCLDPSGYVKGWSVEAASARLAAAGSRNHCVNAGGDVRTRGRQASGEPWQIGIRHPWLPDRLSWVLAGEDLAVATSGTYERGYHVIDPRTGQPATAVRSVSVVGADLGLADAYATAALAMGLAGLDWLALLAERGYESSVVTADGRAFRSVGLPIATDTMATTWIGKE